MRTPALTLIGTLFVLAITACTNSSAAPTSGPASATYNIVQDGKSLGSATYTLTPIASGYTITSQGKMALAKFSYAFSNTEKLDGALNMVNDQISGVVNGSAVSFNAASDTTGNKFNINVSASGKQYQNVLDRYANTVVLPDLDPSGYMLLARLALAPPATSWALIPKGNGLLVPLKFTPDADVSANYHGQSILVKHTTVAVSTQNAITVELYYLPSGQLLEADLPEQNFYVIFGDFKLINRPQYKQLPRGQAAPPPQGQAQQPQQ
ncbi:hypothetical protein C7378_1891 [Acidipila rosea]|uniref:Uncharacterized protein n=2 Tax=Acidipila rosea TaxID=768535 RepID=A0A4R1LCJ7_9BACT|nr:hypothetical protein C7378_1891 [Acidipila rosea]